MKALKILAVVLLIIMLPVFVFAVDEISLKKGAKGVDVFILQNRLRDMGYISFRATGKFSDMTFDGVIKFKENNGIRGNETVDADIWGKLFSYDMLRTRINSKLPRVYGPGNVKPFGHFGYLSKWSRIDKVFKVGDTIEIIDCNTSTSIKVTRTGGINHADVEVATIEDKEAFLKCFKGYTWEKRSFIAIINGDRYAASLFGMPNAHDNIEGNDLDGALCLYFNESTPDFCSSVDEEHKNNILKAAGKL